MSDGINLSFAWRYKSVEVTQDTRQWTAFVLMQDCYPHNNLLSTNATCTLQWTL